MEPQDLTELINQMGAGDEDARRLVLEEFYPEFLRIAHSVQNWYGGSKGETQTIDLVSDAVVRLVPLRRQWKDRKHFLATFCRAVRSTRVDEQRRRRVRSDAQEVLEREWNPWVESPDGLQMDVLDLEEQLLRLSEKDPLTGDILTMHFYGQLSFAAISEELGIPEIKARRLWLAARSVLRTKLGEKNND